MSLQPQHWSVNALATEFRIDRRTVAKRIAEAGVRPASEQHGAPRYVLAHVLPVLLPPRELVPAREEVDPRVEIPRIAVRGVFALGRPLVEMFQQHGLSEKRALTLTREVFRVLNQQAREALGMPQILDGLPIDLGPARTGAPGEAR